MDTFQQLLKDKSIALLGNAESVLKKKKDIDKFDIVARCNRGYPKGKEEYIGSRTDVLFLSIPSHDRVIKEEYDPKCIMWCTPLREGMSDWLLANTVSFSLDDWNDLVIIIGARPSTGCIAITYLVKYVAFKSLTLFGFDFWSTPNWYTGCKNIRNHSPVREREYIETMRNDKRITICR